MSDGDKRKDNPTGLIVLLCALAVALGLLAIGLLYEQKLQYNNARDYQADKYAEQPSGLCFKLPPFVSYCPQEQGGPRAEAQRSDNDLKSQQEMADWAFWMVIVSAGGFLLSLTGVVLIYATFRATRDQVDQAKRQTAVAEAQTRAYLTCTGGSYLMADGYMSFDLNLRNAGNSTAKNVVLTARAIFARPEPGQGESLVVETSETGEVSAIEGNTIEAEISPFWASIEGVNTNEFIASDDYPKIRAGRSHFNVDCSLSWEDTFGNGHTSRFHLFPIENMSTDVLDGGTCEGDFKVRYFTRRKEAQ